MKHEKEQVWIGLIKVEQETRKGPLGDADRAYTNVVGLSKSKAHFRASVARTLDLLELRLLRLEGAELLEERLSKHSVHKRILKLANRLSLEKPVAFDVFATYDA